MMYWYGGSGWGYAFMMVSMVVFWGLVIGAIVVVVRSLDRARADGPAATGAEEALAERYARGDIDQTEYRQRLSVLRESRELTTR
jgi:putative membrane protein